MHRNFFLFEKQVKNLAPIVEKNRILGIRLDSKKPIDTDMMTEICINYRLSLV